MAKVYKGAFSGTLPITVSGTGSGVLASYRIFGNDGGVGVETEASGYKLPILSNSTVTDIYIGDTQLAKDEYVDSSTGKIYRRTKNLSPPEEEWMDEWIWGDGTIHPSTEIKTSPFIDVSTCETCIMEVFSAETEWAAAGYRAMAFYDENKQYLGWIGGGGGQTLTPNSTERWSEFPVGTVYVRIGCSHGDQPFYPQLVSGYTPTHQFYPYLVPTDPPVPFPQIPTFAGTTVIDYAGEGLAPSQFDGVAGWGNLPVHQLKGVPYTGTLPATLQTVEGYLESYKIYGNTVQDGTPTPENPVDVVGCGERVDIAGLSEPLCGIGTHTDSLGLSTGILTRKIKKVVLTGKEAFTKNDGQSTHYLYYATKEVILPSSIGKTPILCNELPVKNSPPQLEIGINTDNVFSVVYFNFGADVMNAQTRGNTVAGLKEYLASQYANGTPVTIWYVLAEPEVSTIPVPSGLTGTIEGYLIQDGTPSPETPIYPTANGVKQADDTYSIPYGYKLPLTVNGVEYPIYLGESQTTRKIKKLVLTGNESWTTYNMAYYIKVNDYYRMYDVGSHLSVCSHYPNAQMYGVPEMHYGLGGLIDGQTNTRWNGNIVFNPSPMISSRTDWISYLAAQYAAGTPVTVWYVLAEPETGIVNEPLMKIGDYADTIDSTQSTVRIPTAAGETTISWAGEGLAPSQFDSIQEWVDKQTYTRVNGEWVADN